MNTNNLEFLQNGLKYLGFDEQLGTELAKKVAEGKEDFQLKEQKAYGTDNVDATLHFRKSDNGEMYFFSRYDANLKKNNEDITQTFYVRKNKGVTLKEAYNLLNGRAVNKDLLSKEGEKYNAWIQLDLNDKGQNGNYPVKKYTTNCGYDLDQAVAKHPIKELDDPTQKDRLMASLQKGNVQSVTFSKDGTEEKMFIEANPQYKTVNVYDGHMKIVKREPNKQDVKEGPAQTGELSNTADKKTEKGKAQKQAEDPLLPKKRKGNKKGIHL